MGDLPSSRPHRKLPAELNREIFLFFNLTAQRKFIYGFGWDFYAMFRHKLLIKTKRVRNPHGNRCNGINASATVAVNGLSVHKKFVITHVFAEKPFPVSGPQCRVDEFPGTICYYYEVKGRWCCYVGLSAGAIPDNFWIGVYSNSFAIPTNNFNKCWLDRVAHQFELPERAILPPTLQFDSNVFGCGLVLEPKDNLSIFFTLNGKLLGKPIPITPSVDRLFPAICLYNFADIEANFGNDVAKPFEYDINNCPGLGLDCI